MTKPATAGAFSYNPRRNRVNSKSFYTGGASGSLVYSNNISAENPESSMMNKRTKSGY